MCVEAGYILLENIWPYIWIYYSENIFTELYLSGSESIFKYIVFVKYLLVNFIGIVVAQKRILSDKYLFRTV